MWRFVKQVAGRAYKLNKFSLTETLCTTGSALPFHGTNIRPSGLEQASFSSVVTAFPERALAADASADAGSDFGACVAQTPADKECLCHLEVWKHKLIWLLWMFPGVHARTFMAISLYYRNL